MKTSGASSGMSVSGTRRIRGMISSLRPSSGRNGMRLRRFDRQLGKTKGQDIVRFPG